LASLATRKGYQGLKPQTKKVTFVCQENATTELIKVKGFSGYNYKTISFFSHKIAKLM
jgi:hypothetical protein